MIWLIIFHFLFFWEQYTDPFVLARSELISTFFPTWCWQSEEIAKGKWPSRDPYFWLVSDAHPVTSSYYPPHLAVGYLLRDRLLDGRWRGFVWSLNLHYLFGSLGWYWVLRSFGCDDLTSVFGSVSLTYQAMFVKQQPCLVYSVNWTPWAILFPSLGIPMMVAGGYLPLVLYLVPLTILLAHNPLASLAGLLAGLIILIPFLRYLPKTIRSAKGSAIEEGFWERRFYFGILPWLLIRSWWSLIALAPVAVSILYGKYLPRVPRRLWVVSSTSICLFSSFGLKSMGLPHQCLIAVVLVQCLDLWIHNRNGMVTRPFSELPEKPSRAFNTPLTRFLSGRNERVSGLPYPLFTGHINHIKTLGYSGGMQLKLMAKWRGDTNPNGSGEHDWFRSHPDSVLLDRYRVGWAISRKNLDWAPTPIRHLWGNPRLHRGGGQPEESLSVRADKNERC